MGEISEFGGVLEFEMLEMFENSQRLSASAAVHFKLWKAPVVQIFGVSAPGRNSLTLGERRCEATWDMLVGYWSELGMLVICQFLLSRIDVDPIIVALLLSDV